MIEYIKRNGQFLFLLLLWVVAGHIAKELAMALVVFTLILLKYKNRYVELVIAFCFLLFLSDNRHHQYDFAKETKDIALVLLSLFVLFDKKQFRLQNNLYYPFISFIILGLLLSYRHPQPFLSFQKSLSYALLFIIIPNYFSKLFGEDSKHFLHSFILFFTLILLLGLSMIVWNNQEAYLVGRYNGLLGNPNGVGTYCTVFTILVTVALFQYPDLLNKKELWMIIIAVGLSVLLSGSRNAIFSILLFLFFRRFYKISYWYGFFIVISSVLLFQLVSQFLPVLIVNLGLGKYFRVEHLDDGSGRLIAWNYAWEEIKRNMLFGKGFSYDEYYFFKNRDALSALGHQGGVHNSYLSIWMNTGITGLILFMFGLFRTFFRASTYCYLAIPALFAILFSISFESWMMGSLNPFTIVALLSVSLMYLKTSAQHAQEKNSIPVL